MIPSINLATDSLGLGQMYTSLSSLFGQKKNREASMEMARMNYDLQKTALQNQPPPAEPKPINWLLIGGIGIGVILLIILITRK
jgi:hypothetical protein